MDYIKRKKRALWVLKLIELFKYAVCALFMTPAAPLLMPDSWSPLLQYFVMWLCGFIGCLMLVAVDDREWRAKKILTFRYKDED